jgi:hypothetical protein|tara:strand:+ start:351 stop:527 length:177 start_codon:yes stop_codon:yes gene_type:complete
MIKLKNLIKNDKGLGDTVSRTIKTITMGKIKECNGCEIRKEYLNKVVPYNKIKLGERK